MTSVENDKKCIVYLIRNAINTKVYVGQTWQTLQKRWRQGRGYDECSLFYNAIRKYGKDNFYYETLREVSTQEEADALEIQFMILCQENHHACRGG